MYTDHKPILGSFASPNLQLYDSVALNAINEIAQHTSDIRYRPGRCSCPNGRNQLFGALLVIWGAFSYLGGSFSYLGALLVIGAKSVIWGLNQLFGGALLVI